MPSQAWKKEANRNQKREAFQLEIFETIFSYFVDKSNRLNVVNGCGPWFISLLVKHRTGLRCSHQRFVVCLDMWTLTRHFYLLRDFGGNYRPAKLRHKTKKAQEFENYWYWRSQENWLLMETYVVCRSSCRRKTKRINIFVR